MARLIVAFLLTTAFALGPAPLVASDTGIVPDCKTLSPVGERAKQELEWLKKDLIDAVRMLKLDEEILEQVKAEVLAGRIPEVFRLNQPANPLWRHDAVARAVMRLRQRGVSPAEICELQQEGEKRAKQRRAR